MCEKKLQLNSSFILYFILLINPKKYNGKNCHYSILYNHEIEIKKKKINC